MYASIVALIVGFAACFQAQGHPSKVGCDLIGDSGKNVMERPVIMDEVVENVQNMIHQVGRDLSADRTDVIISLKIKLKNEIISDTSGALIHTSFGRLTGLPSQFEPKVCTEFNSSVYYTRSLKNENIDVTLEAPINSPPIYVSVLAAKGYGKVYRQRKLVYVGSEDMPSLFPPSPTTTTAATTTEANKEPVASSFPNSFATTSATPIARVTTPGTNDIPENANSLIRTTSAPLIARFTTQGTNGTPKHHSTTKTTSTNNNVKSFTSAATIGVDVSGDLSNSLTDVEVIYHDCSDVDKSIKTCLEERGPWKWTCFDEALIDIHPCSGGRILNKDGVCVEPKC